MKLRTGSRWALRLGLVAVVVCVCARPAETQDPNLKPTFGAVALKAGFDNDPFKKEVIAGGPIKTNLGGVNSWVNKPPDFRLNYTAGTFPLTFHVKCPKDTTLLINLPDGTWIADDDGDGFPNPKIKLTNPQSGQYDIWVGSFAQNENPKATLFITELK